MAATARIDGIVRRPDGRIEVRYTLGRAPLPATWQGVSDVYPSIGDLRAAVAAMLDDVSRALPLLALASALGVDRTAGALFDATAAARVASTEPGVPVVTAL